MITAVLMTTAVFICIKNWNHAPCTRVTADGCLCPWRRRFYNFTIHSHQDSLRGEHL